LGNKEIPKPEFGTHPRAYSGYNAPPANPAIVDALLGDCLVARLNAFLAAAARG
jgi:hypothetical protein